MNKYIIIAITLICSFLSFFFTHSYYISKINEIEKEQLNKENNNLKKINSINEEKSKLEESLKIQEKESYDKIKKLQDTNASIANDVATYKRRLFVKVRNSGKTCLPEDGTTKLSNGEARTEELDSTTSGTIISITNKGDKYKQQLEELQNYINKYNENVDNLNKNIDKKYK